MKFYTGDGVEVDIKQFEPDSIAVARVTKPMTGEEFAKFCKNNNHLCDKFDERGISLIWCPDWVEFKDWK